MRRGPFGALAVMVVGILLVGGAADALVSLRQTATPHLLMMSQIPLYESQQSGAGIGSAVLGTLGGLLIGLVLIAMVMGVLHWLGDRGGDRPDHV